MQLRLKNSLWIFFGALLPVGLLIAFLSFRTSRPNVVILVSDALRQDHLMCYGYERDTSRFIDSVLEEAALFQFAYAQSPSTKPSIASLFTSRFPNQHKVLYNKEKLPSTHTTLAEILKKEGYATAGFIENSVIDERFGFNQGFDRWILDAKRHKPGDKESKARRTNNFQRETANFDEEIVFWIRSNRNQRFFLYVHYIDPHNPYHAPEGYRDYYSQENGPTGEQLKVGSRWDEKVTILVDKYDEEIRYVDDRFGFLIDEMKRLRLLDKTVLVFLSDHGEGFSEHGYLHHSYGVYGELINVPLMIRYPKALAPSTYVLPVQHVDLLPTILDLVNIDSQPYSPSGTSIISRLKNKRQTQQEEVILSEHLRTGWGTPQRAVIFDGWKLITDLDSDACRLFKTVDDPHDREDLSGSNPQMVKKLRAMLDRKLRAFDSSPQPEKVDLDPQLEQSLKSLGYF